MDVGSDYRLGLNRALTGYNYLMARPVYLCPICEREMLSVGFCHLVCPSGHYQEVCSDLFPPDRIVPNRVAAPHSAPGQNSAEAPRPIQTTKDDIEFP